MENIQDLPKSVRERIEELKQKDPLNEEEVAFLLARREYLTEEEKEKVFGRTEEATVAEETKKRRGNGKKTSK